MATNPPSLSTMRNLVGIFLPEHSLTLTRPEPIPVFGQKETPALGSAARDGRRNSGLYVSKADQISRKIKHELNLRSA